MPGFISARFAGVTIHRDLRLANRRARTDRRYNTSDRSSVLRTQWRWSKNDRKSEQGGTHRIQHEARYEPRTHQALLQEKGAVLNPPTTDVLTMRKWLCIDDPHVTAQFAQAGAASTGPRRAGATSRRMSMFGSPSRSAPVNPHARASLGQLGDRKTA